MNVQKSIAAAAILIGLAGTAGIALYSNALVGNAVQSVDATASTTMPSALDSVGAPFRAEDTMAPGSASSRAIPTLPTIVVRPSKEQLRKLQMERGSATSGLRMPYYSFSSDAAGE